MAFIFKIFFAACVFILVGAAAFIATKDVDLQQETVTKTVSAKDYMSE